jgi:hypothetical protein
VRETVRYLDWELEPADRVHPEVLAAMDEVGLDLRSETPKQLTRRGAVLRAARPVRLLRRPDQRPTRRSYW